MQFKSRRPVFAGVALCLASLLVPLSGGATLLWGHPYAMQADTTNRGWVHMFNAQLVYPYVGVAKFPSIPFQPGGQNMWDMLIQGMVNKKLCFVWTDAGPDSNINDLSQGNIRGAVVTIFGN